MAPSLSGLSLLWHESVLPCACDKPPYDLAVRFHLRQVLDVCPLHVIGVLSDTSLLPAIARDTWAGRKQRGYDVMKAHLANASANRAHLQRHLAYPRHQILRNLLWGLC